MEEYQSSDPVESLLSEFSTRLNEIEEKQRILKDRLLLIGKNLINSKEETEKNIMEMKKQIMSSEDEIRSIKRLNKRIINEIQNFARKSEVDILDRQIKMFDPLFNIEKIRKIVSEEVKKHSRR